MKCYTFQDVLYEIHYIHNSTLLPASYKNPASSQNLHKKIALDAMPAQRTEIPATRVRSIECVHSIVPAQREHENNEWNIGKVMQFINIAYLFINLINSDEPCQDCFYFVRLIECDLLCLHPLILRIKNPPKFRSRGLPTGRETQDASTGFLKSIWAMLR